MFIAVDIGGTNIRVVGSEQLDSPIFTSLPHRSANGLDYEINLSFIVKAAQEISNGSIDALGIGTNGTPDADRSNVVTSNNGKQWIGKPFVEDLNHRLGCPVFMDNDAVAAALGEAYWGDVNSNFAYIVWGTGVGGVLIKHTLTGSPTIRNLNDSWDDYFAAWEEDCGGRYISEKYQKPTEAMTQADWTKVFAKFEQHAKKFVDRIHPEAMVIGEGLALLHKDKISSLGLTLGVPTSTPSLGNSTGLYGPLALIKQRFSKSL